MKEIKFRCWGKMHYGDVEKYWTKKEMEEIGGYYYTYGVSQYEGRVLEQFTGLKDKNEKDIYEGDIVKATGENCPNKYTTVIEWRDFAWCTKNEYLNDCYEEEEFEVIGNIHENPELL